MTDLTEALARIARTDTLLVALDFDGTLAPLVDDPADARALPRARDAVLALLELPHTKVALISGRAMDSLMQVSQLPDAVLLSGSHGVELRLDAEASIDLNADELRRRDQLKAALADVAARHDRVWIEEKPAGFALHTRLASAASADAAVQEAADAVSGVDGITSRPGSNVLEFSVRQTTKGDAVQRLREYSGASAVFFSGDDVTDEDAFSALGPDDLGVKCGDGATAARFSVPGTAEIAEVLHQLVALRASHLG